MAKKIVKGKARKGSVAKALVQAVKAVATPPKKTVKGKKFVYFFGAGKAEGNRTMKDTLGGKGAGLAEMTNAGLPVPPGFTISTDACNVYYAETAARCPPSHRARDRRTTSRSSRRRPARSSVTPAKPLLVSVRSGAKFSMPGMMDTILNLGLNDETVEGLKAQTGNGRFAYDSYRRFIQMFGNVVLEHPEGDVRARVRGGQARARRQESTPTSTRAACRRSCALQDGRQGEDRQRLPAGSLDAAARRARRRVPVVERTSARSSTAASTTSRTTSAPPSTSRRWSSATPATARPPASASRAIRPRARTSSSASSWSTRRARTSSPASARRCRSPSSRR